MIFFVVVICVLAALGFGLASAWSDFKGFTIPNIYSLGVVLSFVLAFVCVSIFGPETGYFSTWQSHLIAGLGTFVITLILFAVGVIGAGDSKLISAFALWVGLQNIMGFMFYMALFGGILGILTLIMKKKTVFPNAKAGSWIERAQSGESAVPYGIAIAFGSIVGFYHAGYCDWVHLSSFL